MAGLLTGGEAGCSSRRPRWTRPRGEARSDRAGGRLETDRSHGRERSRSPARGHAKACASLVAAPAPWAPMSETTFEKLILERQFVGPLQAHAEVFFRLSNSLLAPG